MNTARMNRAFSCGVIGDFDQEIACYDEVITRSDSSDTRGDKSAALVALMYKSRRLAELGRAEEALTACEDYIRRTEDSADEIPIETRLWVDWHATGTCALALMAGGAAGPAMDAFRAAYASFSPRHEMALGKCCGWSQN